jgi:hypothetical protein
MKTYLVIESKNVLGKVAYIETVTESDNLLKYSNDDTVLSVSAYTTKKSAQQQVDFLNELYKEKVK